MTNRLIIATILTTGCAAAPPPAPTDTTPAATTPSVLEHSIGHWIETPTVRDDALSALCATCEITIAHELALDDGVYTDAIRVSVTASGASALPVGSVLCEATRVYAVAAEQPYPSGEMVDYAFVSDTCHRDPVGSAAPGYALWVGVGDVLQVLEAAPAPDARVVGFLPFTAWRRASAAIVNRP
jgi:hypothetical protein